MSAILTPSKTTYLPVAETARQLGVAVRWLTAEARAGRVPSLQAGRRLLCRPDEVQDVLARRERATLAPTNAGGPP